MIVELTPAQDEEIRPLMERIAEMAKAGKPGMLVAQIFPGHMRVGVVDNEKGRLIASDPEKTIMCAPELSGG